MFNLIRKDFLANITFVIVSLILSTIAIIVLKFDESDYSILELYGCLVLCFTYIVGHSCYVDEKGYSKMWMRSLPIKPTLIIDAKYALMIISILISFVIYIGVNFIVSSNLSISIMKNIVVIQFILGMHLFYCGIYLFLFYRFSYSTAQQSVYFMILVLLLTKMAGSKKYFDITIISLDIISFVVLIFGLVVLVFSWRFTRKKEE